MTKKLRLNKQTVSNLSRNDLNNVKAGGQQACWENLWTMYYCNVVYTGLPQTDAQPLVIPEDTL